MGFVRALSLSFLNSVMIVSDLIFWGFCLFAINLLGFFEAFQSILFLAFVHYFIPESNSLGKEVGRTCFKMLLPMILISAVFQSASLSSLEMQQNLKLHYLFW